MGRVACLLLPMLVLTFANPSARADEHSPALSPAGQDVIRLIDEGLDRNFGAISNQAVGLSRAEQVTIYKMSQHDAGFPTLVNALGGFGLGSFLDNDINSGILLATGEIIAFILVLGGTYIQSQQVHDRLDLHYSYQGDQLTKIGWQAWVSLRILSWWVALISSGEYNYRLKLALDRQPDSSSSYAPGILKISFTF